MRRQTLRATPAMLKRAAEMYRPFGYSPVLIGKKPADSEHEQRLDMVNEDWPAIYACPQERVDHIRRKRAALRDQVEHKDTNPKNQ